MLNPAPLNPTIFQVIWRADQGGSQRLKKCANEGNEGRVNTVGIDVTVKEANDLGLRQSVFGGLDGLALRRRTWAAARLMAEPRKAGPEMTLGGIAVLPEVAGDGITAEEDFGSSRGPVESAPQCLEPAYVYYRVTFRRKIEVRQTL